MSGRHPSISISDDVRSRHPGASTCLVTIGGLATATANLSTARLATLWERAAGALTTAGITMETITEQPSLRAWREATSAAGLKPSNFRSSVEALTRRVLKDGQMATDLALVDAYCALSVIHQVPLGAWDLARLPSPEIELRLARPATDRYIPLGAPADQMPLTGRIVVYAAGDTILCWNFNHRDSAETSLVAATERAVFVSEALDPAGHERSLAALGDIVRLIGELGGTAGDIVSTH